MKRAFILAVIFTMVLAVPAFAGFGSTHHNYNTTNNTTNNIDESITNQPEANASSVGVGVGVGISANKNKNVNDVDVTNKVNNDVKNNVNVDTTDVNINKNKQKQAQGQMQGQLQGQSQDASNSQSQGANNKQGQTTDVNIEDNSVSEDNSIAWSQGSLGVAKGVNSVGLVHPIFGGIQAGRTEAYAKIMENINTTTHLYEKGLISQEVAQERIAKLLEKLDAKTLCSKKFLGVIKFGNPILDLLSFDMCTELK